MDNLQYLKLHVQNKFGDYNKLQKNWMMLYYHL